MSTDANLDKQLGIKVERAPYAEGEPGIQFSLVQIAKRVREGAKTAVMKSFAGNVLKQAGFPDKVRARCAAFLEFVRRNVAYAPDTPGCEVISSAAVTLCVEGAPVCIPIGDCDDLVTALATLVLAAGIPVNIVRQFYGEGIQQHVLVEAQDEAGSWIALDPSTKMPVGRKAPAVQETRVDPMDDQAIGLIGAPSAEFIGIGRLAVFVGIGKAWVEVNPANELTGCGLGSGVKGARAWRPIDTLPPQVAAGPRGEVVYVESQWWYVDNLGAGQVYTVEGCCDTCAFGGSCGLDRPRALGLVYQGVGEAIPFVVVTDNTVRAGLRYQVTMSLSFPYNPDEAAVEPNGIFIKFGLHPAALAEVRARFGNDWLVETAAATSAATKNKAFDTYPYSQEWTLTGLAKKDAVLVDDKPGAQQQGLWAVPISPFIVYKSIAVQASSASPLATTPQVDPLAPKVPPAGGFDFTNALLGAGAVALVGGVGWHLYSKKKRRK